MFKLIQDRFQACKNKFAALEDILPESPPSSAYRRCTSGLSKGIWDYRWSNFKICLSSVSTIDGFFTKPD